ncbi:hypothetical protein ACET3X_007771 [Alternaria dauci]|uniref:Apple domain-containing protein n=1 Tax=Alternaria dauci TaxID=48095 RepID=A0ABR3UDC0_9PLEO
MYLVECGSDYTGGEIPGPTSPTWPGSYEKCLADCASTSGCVAVSYVVGGPCYLKSSINGARSNSNVIGGRLISIVSTSVAPTSSVATSSRITSSSPVAATSSTSVTSAAPTPNPSTVTVTTTISSTAYQCACTPTSVFSTSSSAPVPSSTTAVTCPGSNGSIFVTSCGASYAVECSADRYGNDLPNGLVYTDTYEQCLQACDKTAGCVNVSWVIGKPGACYMKGSIGAIRDNVNIIGARKLSGCVPLKLHRKRVAVPAREQKLAKRAGYYGPDFTFVQERVVATATATVLSTVTTTSSQTFGTATQTAFTLASATVATTTSVPTTVYNIITVTTCPLALPIR